MNMERILLLKKCMHELRTELSTVYSCVSISEPLLKSDEHVKLFKYASESITLVRSLLDQMSDELGRAEQEIWCANSNGQSLGQSGDPHSDVDSSRSQSRTKRA